MQKRKLKLANIVGIVVFACALVLNIQTSMDGAITMFQNGVAQDTGGTEGDGSGGDGSGSEGQTGYAAKTEATSDVERTTMTEWGTECKTKGTLFTVSCTGEGIISCTPSSTWLSGPYYSEGCTAPE